MGKLSRGKVFPQYYGDIRQYHRDALRSLLYFFFNSSSRNYRLKRDRFYKYIFNSLEVRSSVIILCGDKNNKCYG